ncbi:RlmE family RNA methyltransferase [Candidatus Woesearchaeota archaeon]|nr:RlmE family RNA methyltransferase [Candidatus Woesearchaeota archaeon]MBW3018326.1 RlmE family RNA methyltransferase [Candidatus Woesearchaeota archaeon]
MKQKDKFTKKALREGYRGRAAYKLIQLNRKYRLIKKGNSVLDLGCAPGSWIQVSSKMVGSKGYILGVDISNIKEFKEKHIEFIQHDITKDEIIDMIRSTIKGKVKNERFDVVTSDMAPKTRGIIHLDQELSLELSMRAFDIAKQFLRKGGNFLCKTFQSKEYETFRKEAESYFSFVKTQKPEASKKRSKEVFLVCKGFKPKKL